MSAHNSEGVISPVTETTAKHHKKGEFNFTAKTCNEKAQVDQNIQNKVIAKEMNSFIEICEDMISVAVHNKMGFIDFEINDKEKKLFPNIQHYIKDVIAKGKEKEFTMKWIEGKNNTSYSNSSFLTTPSVLHVSWE